MKNIIKKIWPKKLKNKHLKLKNKHLYEVLESYDITPQIILDIGANKGLMVDIYSKKFPLSKIHAFEAIPELSDELRNTFHNDSNITIVPNALDKEEGVRSFNQTVISGNSSFFDISEQQKQSSHHDDVTRVVKSIDVQCTTLDNYAQKNQIEIIDFLKIDIQGAEVLAFEGAKKLLENGSISAIYVEVMFSKVYENQCFYHDIASLLLKNGYWFYNFFDSSCQADGSLIHSNALFFSSNISRKKWS